MAGLGLPPPVLFSLDRALLHANGMVYFVYRLKQEFGFDLLAFGDLEVGDSTVFPLNPERTIDLQVIYDTRFHVEPYFTVNFHIGQGITMYIYPNTLYTHIDNFLEYVEDELHKFPD